MTYRCICRDLQEVSKQHGSSENEVPDNMTDGDVNQSDQQSMDREPLHRGANILSSQLQGLSKPCSTSLHMSDIQPMETGCETKPNRIHLSSTYGSKVRWVKHQTAHYRDKRAAMLKWNDRISHEIVSREIRIPVDIYNVIDSEEGLRDPLVFNDPYWPMQWELYNRGQYGRPKRFDLNIMPVWKKNITGKGVVVTVIDDGVDHTNKDLKKNFVILRH
nr:PREDICTED: neuroendocrine convertase 1-like [Latimeria chalumnae]|eukprot:XP_014345732.1 PREDICTED: neuroendocrine convertase 1-like [Latimeria chalumnae]